MAAVPDRGRKRESVPSDGGSKLRSDGACRQERPFGRGRRLMVVPVPMDPAIGCAIVFSCAQSCIQHGLHRDKGYAENAAWLTPRLADRAWHHTQTRCASRVKTGM